MSKTKISDIHTGQKIERLRRVAGISQKELGICIGNISRQAISKIESSSKVNKERVEQIIDVLGYSRKVFDSLTEKSIVEILNRMSDSSIDADYEFPSVLNPIEKLIELYERLLQLEKDKVEKLQNMLKLQVSSNIN